MPHRVATFIGASLNSLENQVLGLKRERRPSPHPTGKKVRSSERMFAYAFQLADDAQEGRHSTSTMNRKSPKTSIKSDKEKHDEHHHHRLSFPGLHLGRSSKEAPHNPGVDLECKIESPPILFHGDQQNSTGALLSGQLFLNIKTPDFQMESISASLRIHVVQKRPFTQHCHNCTHQYTDVKKWTFLQTPLNLAKGSHQFPFSVLLEGHLPTSMDGPLMSVSYELKAEVNPMPGYGVPVKFEKILEVRRSLPPSDVPHHSIRVFPPTNIKASVHFPQVIHPIGSNNLTMRMDGIAKLNDKAQTIEYWKLKKLTWRLEETVKTVAPACEKHAPKDTPKEDDSTAPEEPDPAKKGVTRTDMHVLGEKTMFSGWKSNYAGAEESNVELELEYMLSRHARHTCDTRSRDGSEVTHQLMVEMVVSQEWAPVGKPNLVTQTGVGRILRMHFATVLTERGGIGISWDNEAPPIYQDVPPSPPAYPEQVVDSEGQGECPLFEDVEALDAPMSPTGTGGSGNRF